MSSSPKTPTPPTLPPGVTKTCHIVKRPDFDGYGFNLHSEKVKPGQFIGKVDAKSPAEAAGLKEGDRILEVNGVSIGNETHKQVVARIKAIANEVRLLLIDVDGKALPMQQETSASAAAAAATATPVTTPTTPTTPPPPSSSVNVNGNRSPSAYEGTKQEIPGASANISSISMVSTKRSSNASSIQSGSTMNASDMDVVDRGMPVAPQIQSSPVIPQNGNKPSSPINNNTLMATPPPPSATNMMNNGNGTVYSSTNGNTNGTSSMPPSSPISTPIPTATTTASNVNRAGSLNLPLTAAEMRAKLASKKKYDPKNESVDLKKKFEIIQKL